MRIEQFNNFQLNILQSILWQYNESTNLLGLLNAKQNWYNINQTNFWEDWYNNIFNLSSPTLTTFGAAIWSIILDLPLYVSDVQPGGGQIWGFNAAGPENVNFNFTMGCFASGEVALNLMEQQFLLRLRYFQLSTRADIVDINAFLAYLCNNNTIGYSGTIYVIDNFNMTITYYFTAANFPGELLIAIKDQDVLPRPAGVKIIYEVV